jgi:hypothetical protein
MGGAIEDDQFFRLRALLILRPNAWQARAVAARVVRGNDEQGWAFQLVGRLIGRRSEHHEAIDFAGLRGNASITSRAAAHTATHNGDDLSAIFVSIADRGQHVQSERVLVAGTMGCPIFAEVDGEDFKARGDERTRLRRPSLFVEAAAMG